MEEDCYDATEAQRIEEEMQLESQAVDAAGDEAEAEADLGNRSQEASRKRDRGRSPVGESSSGVLEVDENAVESVPQSVGILQDGQYPVVPGMEDIVDDNDDGAGSQAGGSAVAANSDVLADEEDEDEGNTDEIASVPLEPWQLGEGIRAVPPSDSRSAANSDWMAWGPEQQGKLRAVRHMVMQRTLETRDNDQNFCSYKGYTEPSLNERVISLAAIEGLMFDTEAKGIFIDGQGLVEESNLPEDEEKREKAVRSMPPIPAYLYKHTYRQEYDAEGVAVAGSPQHGTDDMIPNTRVKGYTAPCMMHCVEPIYMKKKIQEGDLPEDHPDYDGRGVEVGTRVHKYIFNRHYSVAAYVAKNMDETTQMNRAARAFRAENKWRGKNIGPERAAKQQRAMVANPDVNWSSGMKFARIQNNYSLVHHFNAAAGVDTGGKCHNVYPDMQKSLGSASLNRPMESHARFGSLHALSPEWAFNGRDGANPPKNLFPDDDFPDMPRRTDPENAVGRAYVSFMTAMDGSEIELDPKQTNPNNYMDDDGFIVFPYPETVQMLCNCLVPLRDATLPLVLSLGAPVGENALDAFWVVNKKTDAVIAAEAAALADATSRKIMSLGLDVKDEAVFASTRERLKRQGRPSFNDMKGRLMHLFDSKMRPDQETASVKRMKASKMVMRDSLDPTPAELSTGPGGFNDEEVTTRRVKLATEETANSIRAVGQMVEEAYAIKMSSSDERERKKAIDWYPLAKRESIDWGLRMMKATYENPKHVNSVYPVARGIWNTTFKMISRLPSVFKHAKVDDTDPRRKNGSINLAFGFNKTKPSVGLSPYGNYMRLLTKVYSKVLGVQGRVLAGRWALHYASLAPIGPPGFKPMLMRNGIRGLNKSGECIAFQYLFNGSWNPDIECQWWQMTGEGSAQSLRAGGISGTSGGVAWSDEALRSISTGGVTNDPAATEKMQDMKILCTQGFLSRPRTYKVSTATGPGGSLVESFRTINDITLDSTQRVMACNTGCNAAHVPKSGPPPRPDADRRALIDRCVSVPATEGALHQCMTDAEFKATVKGEAELVWTHNLMTRLTYIVFDCVCLVPEWQASNEKAARDAWSMLDTYMNHNFDIPIPEPRRQTQRRNIAIIKSIERALASYLLFKEEAVAFSEMLPISQPFSQDDDPSKCVHTLAPFDIGQLVNVISTLVYDQEVILDTFSLSLDSNMWTTNELHHILVKMSAMHGVQPPTDLFMRSGVTETCTSSSSNGIVFQPRPSEQQQQPAAQAQRQRQHFGPYGSEFDDGSEEFGSGSCDAPTGDDAGGGNSTTVSNEQLIPLPNIEFTYTKKGGHARTQPILNTCQRFFERRRKILMEFIRKSEALSVTVPGSYEKNKVSSKVELVMCTHVERNSAGVEVKQCRLDDGTVESLAAVQDMVLVTSGEVISCGYTKQDVSNWLQGEASSSQFSPQEGETVFLGVKTNSWTFKRRSDVERSTEHVYDPAWRTTGVSPPAAMVVGTPVATTFDGAAPATGASQDQAVQGRRVDARNTGPIESKADSHIWKESRAIAELLSTFNLDSAQVFDRIIQIVDSNKDNYRRIQLSPEVKRDTLCVKELDSAESTLMRRYPENFSKERVTAMDDSHVADALGTESIVKSGVTTQTVLPFSAVSFSNTLGSISQRMHKSRRVREWITFENQEDANGLVQLIQPDDVCQRRLDALIDVQALPAAVPLMSTTVAFDRPLKVFNDALYLNSGFAMNIMRLEYEIIQYFKTVPGLRLQEVGEKEPTPGASSHVDSPSSPSPSAASSNRDASACESIPDDASPPSPSGDSAPTTMVVSKSIAKCAKDIVNDGRTTFTPLDVDRCIHDLRYETKSDNQLFDKAPIFYTLKLHELFNYCDGTMCKYIIAKFPEVFRCMKQVEGIVPETVTRFYENEHEAVVHAMIKSDINLSNKLLSTAKRFEYNESSGNSAKKARRDFTEHELAKIRATHRENTGEDVKDLEKLRTIASEKVATTRAESASACDRSQWRQNAVECKVKCGMVHPRGALKNVIADVGIGLLAKVRTFYAEHPEKTCPDPTMRRGIEFLRPLKASKYRGTCSESERDVVEISLMKEIDRLSPHATDSGIPSAASGSGTAMEVEMDDFNIAPEHAAE